MRVPFALNGFLFALGGFTLINEHAIWSGLIQIFASLLNFSILLKSINIRWRSRINEAILIMNIVVALSIASNYHTSGKSYIQYAWLMTALMSFVVLFLYFRKKGESIRI